MTECIQYDDKMYIKSILYYMQDKIKQNNLGPLQKDLIVMKSTFEQKIK